VGPAGANGTDGNTVLNGTGAPASSLGNDGDFYLDTQADVLYGPKAGGAWPMTGTSLVGPAGPAGTPGSGATVTPLSSGDSHCGNGGAAVTDGNGNTAYACSGATGPAGPAGVGTAGPSGLNLVTVDAVAHLVVNGDASTDAFAAVQCPSSHPYVVSGGGYFDEVEADGPFLFVDTPVGPSNYPGGQTGWAVQGVGGPPDGLTSSDELFVWAICSE
jgi:hypothetical protein